MKALAMGLLTLPSVLLVFTSPVHAQAVTRSAAYNPVPQVDDASDSRSLDYGDINSFPVGSVRIDINFTKCGNSITPNGSCEDTTSNAYYNEIGFTLRGPDGRSVNLVVPNTIFSGEGGEGEESGDNLGGTFNFSFEDAATNPIANAYNGTTLISGLYLPQSLLSLFEGTDARGLWTLIFTDAAGGDPLSLNSWSLTLTPLGIVSKLPAIATAPYSTIFAGGTLLVDAPGTYTQNWFLLNIPGSSIDLGGVSSTFSGIFSGPGGINFINSGQGGRLELSGINTYTGPTTVEGGAHLAVNGSIASSSGLNVLGGSKISGNGQLPGTSIGSRGILAPGNSIGTLMVNGDFAFQDGIYELELQGPQNDSVAVTGNVSAFNGTVRLLPFGGGTAFPGFTYVALTAPNADGFANPTSLNLDASGLPASVVLSSGTTLVQNSSGNPRQLDLQFRPRDPAGAVTAALKATGAGNSNSLQSASVFDVGFRRLAAASAGNANAGGSPIGSTGFTTNQAAAAGITPGFLQVQASLLALTTPEQLKAAVQSIVPENYAAFQAVALNSLKSQRELLFSQADSCLTNGWVLADASTGKTPRQPICVFATGGNTTASITGSNGLSNYNAANAGGLYGLEWKTAPAWTIGAAYGYGTANLSNLGVTANSVHSVVNSGSLYGVYKPATNWSIKGLFAYSNFNIDGQRNTPFLGNGSPITGNTTGQGFTTGLRAEMNLPIGSATSSLPLNLKPMLGLAYGAYQQGSFNESGNDSLQLDVAQHSAQSLVGSLGAELSSRIVLDAKANNAFVPKLTLAYQVDALANDSSNYSLDANLPAAGSGFTTIGQSYGANNLLVGGSMELQIANKAAIYASVNYQVFNSGNQFSYGGGLKYLF
jgi:uncharacterized protein YhjY with autotransporter beta-barrel domain